MPNTIIRKFWKWFCNLLALLMLFQIGLGWYMTDLGFYHRWYHSAPALHKSIGIVILVMTLTRLSFRLKEGLPKPKLLFQSIKFNIFGRQHYLLYTFLLTITTTGYLFSTSKGDPVPFFGLFDIPSLFKRGDTFRNITDWIHIVFAYTLAGGIIIHSIQMMRAVMKRKRV